MQVQPEVITLYRYFAFAAFMRHRFSEEVDPNWLKMLSADMSGLLMFMYSSPGIYLQYSYAGIYLVIEGWRDLGLRDDEIDQLLESPFVDRLRLFRNATFHYQREPVSWKHLQFFGTEEERTEVWLNDVYAAFGRYFRANTLQIPEALQQTLKNKTHVEIAQAVQTYWKEYAGEPPELLPPLREKPPRS